MPAAQTTPSFNEALLRQGGMYGSAWRDGKQLAEVVEVSVASEVNRIEVPLVGTNRTGYKPGRVTREGSLRVQKIDAKWEMEVYNFLSKSIEARRADRDAGIRGLTAFSLVLENDDPDALGIEKWQLDGCLLWRLGLGINIGEDITEREYPLTWESETPIYVYEQGKGPGGIDIPVWYEGFGPPTGA